jgi:hypothetical protein
VTAAFTSAGRVAGFTAGAQAGGRRTGHREGARGNSLLGTPMSRREIADQRYASLNTVKTHQRVSIANSESPIGHAPGNVAAARHVSTAGLVTFSAVRFHQRKSPG